MSAIQTTGHGVPKQDALPRQARNFDQLPDGADIPLPHALHVLGCSRSAAYRRIAAGLLPPLIKRGQRAVFNVGFLRAAMRRSA